MTVEQPETLELEDGVVVHNGGLPEWFKMPKAFLDNVRCWIHEFTECAVMNIIEREVDPSSIYKKYATPYATPAHILTSLHLGCYFEGKTIDGEEYAKIWGVRQDE